MTHQGSSARRHRAGRPTSRRRGVIGITAAIGLVITGASGVWAAPPERAPASRWTGIPWSTADWG